MKLRMYVFAALLPLLATTGLSQKQQEKPKIHSDFSFGTYPISRDAETLLANEKVRLLLVGFHNKWDIEKIAKEAKQSDIDLDRLFADLQENRLADELDQFSFRPMLPVIRDKDLRKIEKNWQTHTTEYARFFRANWSEIETAAASLTGAKDVPKEQLLYQIVVGGILFGGMHDVFFEDQTIMVNPPRRLTQRYYAWMVEGDPKLAGVLKREQWESDGYTMVSIGRGLLKNKSSLSALRSEKGMVLEEAEGRKYRTFITIFGKDKVLPWFKKNRESIRTTIAQVDAGEYTRLTDIFPWYYDQMANGVVNELVAGRLIEAPREHYTFAVKAPGR